VSFLSVSEPTVPQDTFSGAKRAHPPSLEATGGVATRVRTKKAAERSQNKDE
jgi:hypothetical protein